MKKTAIVLMNLGGPGSMEEVKPFLMSLFYDKEIITLPNPLRWMVAKLISSRRESEAKHIYSQMGGRSPILDNTKAQAFALQEKLGPGYKVFVAMRHAYPRTEHTMVDVAQYGPDEIVLLPLYPQLSNTTTTSSLNEWKKLAKHLHVKTREICCYPEEDGFIDAMSKLTKMEIEKAGKTSKPKVIFTAHGLPEKIVKRGDPYQNQIEKTVNAIVEKMGVNGLDYVISYQSRVGPLKWIEPYTDQEIENAALVKKTIVVVPVSFVSEHSETLVELDIQYREMAENLGCPGYFRVPTVGDHPDFISGLASLVLGGQEKFHCGDGFKRCYCLEKKYA